MAISYTQAEMLLKQSLKQLPRDLSTQSPKNAYTRGRCDMLQELERAGAFQETRQDQKVFTKFLKFSELEDGAKFLLVKGFSGINWNISYKKLNNNVQLTNPNFKKPVSVNAIDSIDCFMSFKDDEEVIWIK